MSNVKIPTRAGILDEKLGDVASPTADLCRALNFMAPDGDAPAIDLIKSDALALSKWTASLVGAGGTLAAVITTVWAWLINPANLALKITLVAATAGIVVVSIAVVGWIVATDVNARATTQQARYAARAHVVHDYLETMTAADFAPSAPEVGVYVGRVPSENGARV